MARAVNQTIAWISSLFFSLMVFAAGYGVFTLLAKSGSSRSDLHSSTEGEGKSSHGAKEHGDESEANSHAADAGHHAEASDEAAASKGDKEGHGKAESHGREKAESKEESHGSKAVNSPASGPEEDGEHEISADQFKGKDHGKAKDGHHH